MSSHIPSASRESTTSGGASVRDWSQLHSTTLGSLRSAYQPSEAGIREESATHEDTTGSLGIQAPDRAPHIAGNASLRAPTVTTIDSLRSGDHVTPIAGSPSTRPQAIQIGPNRRHASSNYHYYPEIFQLYGISKEDWSLFTIQFVNANLPTRNELIAILSLTLTMQAMFIFGLGPVGFPLAALASTVFMEGPVFFKVKGRRLKRNVRNGIIPDWLAAWNVQYFNPKGLMIGFNLAGRRVKHAAVAPRIRKHTSVMGTYKKPKSRSKVKRRARLVVVKLHDPVPEAGTVPKLDPMKIAGLFRMMRHPKSPFTLSSKFYSKIEAKKREIERVRQQKAQVSINGLDGSQEELRPGKKWLVEWTSQAAFRTDMPLAGTTTSKVSWREKLREKSKDCITSFDGTALRSPETREQSRWRKTHKPKRSNVKMLGGSRIGDASTNVL